MSIFNVERDAVPVGLLGNVSTTLTVVGGDTLYYADNSQVSSTNNQGSLTSGNSATFTNNVWIVSASASSVSQSFTAAPTGGGGGNSFIGTALASQAYVDLCAAPYSCTPGTDITSALQTAINAASQDTTLFFSRPGVYNVNGAAQSGSGTINGGAYSYSGQILFPARHFSQGPLSIRIMGANPVAGFEWGDPANEPVPTGGVVLLSNATAGWIFDAIPIDNLFGSGATPVTDVHVQFENITVRGPSNPQGAGAINGLYLASLVTEGRCGVDTSSSTTLLTGSGIGIQYPPYDNMALARQSGDLQVYGWPTAIVHSEHFISENISIARCIAGMAPKGTNPGHVSVYGRVLCQGVQYPIQPAGTVPQNVRGLIDVLDEGGAYHCAAVINDPSSLLRGELVVEQWTTPGAGPWPSAAGFPVIGTGPDLRLVPHNGRPSHWPNDDFTRNNNLSNAWTGNYIGVTANTHHVWTPLAITGSPVQTNWVTNGNNNLKSAGVGAWPMAVIRYRSGRAGRSRVIRSVWAITGAYNPMTVVGYPISGANVGNILYCGLSQTSTPANAVYVSKRIGSTSTTLATSAAGAVASGNTYTFDVVVSNPVGGPYQIALVINGTIVPLTIASGAGSLVTFGGVANGGYQLAATEVAQFTDTNQTDTQDGVAIFSDTGSSCSYWAAMPN